MWKRLFAFENLLSWLLVFVPIAAYLKYMHGNEIALFITSCLAIIPLAGLMGHATEALSVKAGPGVGGLLNASFGNAAELIIAFMALRAGHVEIVQASITGSIIGNLLLVLGLAVFAGGLTRERQTFNRTAAGVGSAMLFLGVVALLIPTFATPSLAAKGLAGRPLDERLCTMSEWIAGVLLLVYVAKLLFSLKTHHHLYSEEADHEAHEQAHWGRGSRSACCSSRRRSPRSSRSSSSARSSTRRRRSGSRTSSSAWSSSRSSATRRRSSSR